MSLKQTVFSILGAAVLFASCKSTARTEEKVETKDSKPNIIYILADDLGIGDVSCYGQKKFQTPHIDKLAQEGMSFTNHYSGSTVCAPSRSVLLTGLHTGHTPVRGNKELKTEGQMPMDSATVTIAEILKEAGYVTGAFGKWGLGYIGSEGDAIKQGFDEFYGYNCQRVAHKYYPTHLWHNNEKIVLEGNGLQDTVVYAQDLIHDEAIKFIEKNKETPFFLYIPYLLPHAELLVPDDSIYRKYDGMYEEPKPYSNPAGDYGNPEVALAKYCSQEKPRTTFAAMVHRLDVYVGEVVEKVKELGLDENTIIMFASDNGPHCVGGADPKFFNSNAELRGMKRDLYEGGIRTAFIARWPGKIKENTKSDHISAFWDIMPTLVDIAQTESLEKTDGISFLPTLLGNGEEQKQHEYLYWEFHERNGSQAIRMGKWKAVKIKVKKKPDVKMELYDLEADPAETNNIAEENPEIVQKIECLFAKSRVPSKKYPFIEKRKKK